MSLVIYLQQGASAWANGYLGTNSSEVELLVKDSMFSCDSGHMVQTCGLPGVYDHVDNTSATPTVRDIFNDD